MSFEEVQSTQLYPEDAKHYIPAQQKLSRPLKGWIGCDHLEHQEILSIQNSVYRCFSGYFIACGGQPLMSSTISKYACIKSFYWPDFLAAFW